ncbi:MAG: monovalent cation/H+ antiporter complex subunit F [Campylobacterota bacterium]|nr:monovalent cation/H+ antiporter complex subunit F [Campylobacterota bacterium]
MFEIVSIVLLFAMALASIRLLKGPTLSDRVVAFDTISIMAVSLLVLLSLYFRRSIYIDIALVFGLIGFLGTTIFGRYIEKGI